MSAIERLQKSSLRLEFLTKKIKAIASELKGRESVIRRSVKRRGYWIDYTYVKGYGPYYRLRWIEDGKLRCKYLGKSPKLPRELERNDTVVKAMKNLAEIEEKAEELQAIIEKAASVLEKALKHNVAK